MIGYKEEKEWKQLLDRIAWDIIDEYSGSELADYVSHLLEFRYTSKVPSDVKSLREEWFEEYDDEEEWVGEYEDEPFETNLIKLRVDRDDYSHKDKKLND